VTADELVRVVEDEPRRGSTRARGPHGLLLTLAQRGLDPAALKAAAALVLALDDAAPTAKGGA
jgi:hypothetical protein